jgi:hypothetical protein
VKAKRIRLRDHFSFNGKLQISNIQPQYGLVQLNYTRRGVLQSSADIKVEALFLALERLFDVTITPN